MTMLIVACLLVSISTVLAQGNVFQSCGDDTHIVYIDGKQVNSQDDQNKYATPISTPIPNDAKVIAVAVTNHLYGAGWKGYFLDGSVVSDGSWKCTSEFYSGWMNVGFDDSNWPAPYISSAAGTCGGFPASAKWLWAKKGYNELITTYCRKTLAKGLTFSSCADDTQIIYLDGKQVASNPDLDNWNNVITVSVPSTTKVIAVAATNHLYGAGWRGAMSDGSVVTDGSWKCTSTFYDGWQNPGFDDSGWASPVVKDWTSGVGCPGFLSDAAVKWLWIDSTYSSLKTSYCRKSLAAKGIMFQSCGDDTHIVYVDGKQVNSQDDQNKYATPIFTLIPYDTKVLAIAVTNHLYGAGWKGNFFDGSVVSDESWKCTSEFYSGWMNVGFDDSNWPTPYTSTAVGTCGGFPASAKWMWAKSGFNELITTYCRRSLAKGNLFQSCADDTQVIYVDGKQVNANNDQNRYPTPIVAIVPYDAKVLAVAVTNHLYGAGWKGYFLDGSVVTDGSWKCTAEFYGGWMNVDFDDSNWPTPYISSAAGTCSGFPASAKWLWAKKGYNELITTYCRKTLAKGLTFSSCADDTQIIYLDGKQVASNPDLDNWNNVITVSVPPTTRVIAVSATNHLYGAGWRGALSDGSVVTDESWKCTNTFTNGWQNPGFDDRGWPAPLAKVWTAAVGCPGLPDAAKWLWTDATYSSLQTIYCRKTIRRDPCDNSPCRNGGKCDSSGASFTCSCAAGFAGSDCSQESDPCSSSPCKNGAGCQKTSGTTFTCQCADGYSGATCNKENDPCSSSPCKNGAGCTKKSGTTFTCQCAAGYSGATCNKESDPCSSSPCKNGAGCTKSSGTTFTCQCAAGFTGSNCEEVAGACAKSPCQNGGTCVPNGADDYDCTCTADYDDGEDCSTYQDPCTSSPCKNGGKCNRKSAQDFSCSCVGDFIGDYCELKKGVDPCANSPCQNGGKCKTTSPTTYKCTCPDKYEGLMCEKIVCLTEASKAACTGLPYGKYAYCSNCGNWVVCRAKKQKLKSCAKKAPNVNYDRNLRACTADKKTACAGLA